MGTRLAIVRRRCCLGSGNHHIQKEKEVAGEAKGRVRRSVVDEPYQALVAQQWGTDGEAFSKVDMDATEGLLLLLPKPFC
ncbi:hypothetical protein V6N13_146447 [Hibiscus sabdariffa]|uniref:Uncharacterized protein n=1 Tax=Hibiscus sabdariffa TaxID=183260 RepID=A0ABR2TSP5_9ROSI